MILLILLAILLTLVLASLFILLLFFSHQKQLYSQFNAAQTVASEQNKLTDQSLTRLEERTRQQHDMADRVFHLLKEERTQFDQHHLTTLKTLQDSLQNGMMTVRRQVTDALVEHGNALNLQVEKLTQSTDQRLKEISGQVDKRLSEGFEKTNATFTDVIKRLALIDEAQKKITELSSNVVSLQEVLADKKSRGAFGEVQLNGLIRNVMPEQSFIFQHTLSNNMRADCILLLPEPTGHMVIDAKFPLENYRQALNNNIAENDRKVFEKAFRKDIRHHIQVIADKYILPGETADGAMLFIPAEAVFAEIHANYPDLVEIAQKSRVWLVSPTTMVAVLTTARAVLKDAATRKQVHIIQEHLGALSKDFQRFQERMDQLVKHIKQAHQDVEDVHISSKKISNRFNKIEKVDLSGIEINKALVESKQAELEG